ncbi:hypothetical protein Poly30_00350 [Planctomycetes bacterium Poly30]|uniref:Uncharacterized protein n=1 Tax=Saltatorellus ferox TaxID=2528018 RepID=A0A518EKC2_9BACT|nr:hypothetical protein Poly30_00350 [Planctomycetes bacterium Poly30]
MARDFQALLDGGYRLAPSGTARDHPETLLEGRRAPRYRLAFLNATYYLSHFAHDDLNFFIAFVCLERKRKIWPRIFYKDSSLVWRVASHVVRTEDENWIGKGDVQWIHREDGEYLETLEETTNLPLEIQGALDDATRRGFKPKLDHEAVELVLRSGPTNRIRPFADFSGPRERAAAEYNLNGGRPIARLKRKNDPTSLTFARGFAPDFAKGHLGFTVSSSQLYNGRIEKHRVLSMNRRVQFQFIASPTHVWMNPPQTLTTKIMSFGVRTTHVSAVDEAFVPGYEFHFYDGTVDPPELHSQIPEGFEGEPSPIDPTRWDASPWNEKLPMIQEFRRVILGGKKVRAR